VNLDGLIQPASHLAGAGAQEVGSTHLLGLWLAERFVRGRDIGEVAGVEFGEGGEMNTIVDIQKVKKMRMIKVTDILGEGVLSVWEG
jgi:hypothetical protein